MSEKTLFKDFINPEVVKSASSSIQSVWAGFDGGGFESSIIPQLPHLELKQRVLLISQQLRTFLPSDYPRALDIILNVVRGQNNAEIREVNYGFALWPYTTFVELYGLDHFEKSLQGIYELTKQFTGEFAIRPYLHKDQDRVLAILGDWVRDEDEHVRRLVSEGTRPYLPWGMNLPAFIKEPGPVLSLLERLKDDPSEYVRRSVANNLNGISKDHPKRVTSVLGAWQEGSSKGTQWITRHALRTLLKEGHPAALALLGYHPPHAELLSLDVNTKVLKMGESLQIGAELKSLVEEDQKLMVDYVVHFVKANGQRKPKVFKWKSAVLPGQGSIFLKKKHTIKPITTRKYYEGMHKLEIQVNGQILGSLEFMLSM